MTKRISLVLCTTLLILWISLIAGLPGHSHAETIWQPVNNFRGYYYQDAEKNIYRGDDDEMCWAASAANILAWTGWADYDEDYVFDFLLDHDPLDSKGTAFDALDFWLYGKQNNGHFAGSTWKGYDMSGYAPQEMYRSEYNSTGAKVYAELEYMIANGYGVSASFSGDIGHAITIWGYDKHPQTGDLTGIYITDSDTWHYAWLLDHGGWGSIPAPNSMEWLGLEIRNNQYYITSSNHIYYDLFINNTCLSGVYGLKQYYEPSPIPIPSAIILLGSGLIGLMGFKRKFKKL